MAKKTAKKKTKTKPDLKNISKPVKVTFAHKKNPQFEAALAEEARIAEEKKKVEAEKAGRAPESGIAEEVPEVSTIPFNAKKAIAPVLKIPFGIWSNIVEIPEIKLSNEEAQEWAEPVVGLLEYYFPGKVPEIAWIWLMFFTSTGHVIDSRIEIQHQHRKKAAAPHPQDEPGHSPSVPGPAHRPKHNGAEPATDFPRMA